MQLRRKLFLVLSFMAMVPLLFLLVEVVERAEVDLETRTAGELQKTLDKMSQELVTLMDNQKSIVRGLSKVPIVREFASILDTEDRELFEAKATQLAAFFYNYHTTVPSIQGLRFVDTKGRTLVKVKEGSLIEARHLVDSRPYVEDISYKPFYRWAMSTQQSISVSDFERGYTVGETDFCPAMIRYSAPIRDEIDVLQGLLVVNMWGRRIDDAVVAALGGYPGKVYIAELNSDPERDGIYLYHEDANKRFSNQLGTPFRLSTDLGASQWAKIKQGPSTGLIRAENDKLLFYRTFAPYDERTTQWLLVIETARDTVLAPVQSLRQWIFYLMLAVLVVSLLSARWIATRLARPVHDLAQLITRYADGEQHLSYHDDRQDEIGSAGRAFNYLTESLERTRRERDKAELAARQSERLAAVGQMAAGIGHEINNPLMNIMSLAALLEQSIAPNDRQAQEDLKALLAECRRCARIVQGILNFARATEPTYEWLDLADLIDDTLAVFEHRLKASGIRLEVHKTRPLMLNGDAGQLQQVLVNVMINAIHAAPAGSTIAIYANRVRDEVHLEVLDEGPGVEEEDLPRVFSPFFSTKPEGAGTGLGLSVSYGIVNKHGGTISLENRSGGGVRVAIVLPIETAATNVAPDVDQAPQKRAEPLEVSHAG